MRIQWIGHASFLIETGNRSIITDPYEAYTGYRVLNLPADIVTISHDHRDHNAVHNVSGHPRIIKGNGAYNLEGIQIEGIGAYHDPNQGSARGAISIYRFAMEGLNLVHLSDLGHLPDAALVRKLTPIDILLVPVGGLYTIDAAAAFETVQRLQPRIVIPMHYKTAHCEFPIAVLEEFSGLFDKYIKLPRLDITAADLPEPVRLIVLEYLAQ